MSNNQYIDQSQNQQSSESIHLNNLSSSTLRNTSHVSGGQERINQEYRGRSNQIPNETNDMVQEGQNTSQKNGFSIFIAIPHYFNHLCRFVIPKKKKNNKPVEPNTIYNRPRWRLRRNRPRERFIWCFRLASNTATLSENQKCPESWTPFGWKNQIELNYQWENISRGITHIPCTIKDRKIMGGRYFVNVLLSEGIAFVLDQEQSDPITYDIQCLPKLNWYQKMMVRHHYRRNLKNQVIR